MAPSVHAVSDYHFNAKMHPLITDFCSYWLVCMCSLGAATQGMDESVNNGANSIYPKDLGFNNKGPIYKGLVVSAPYLACAVLGCWLTGMHCIMQYSNYS